MNVAAVTLPSKTRHVLVSALENAASVSRRLPYSRPVVFRMKAMMPGISWQPLSPLPEQAGTMASDMQSPDTTSSFWASKLPPQTRRPINHFRTRTLTCSSHRANCRSNCYRFAIDARVHRRIRHRPKPSTGSVAGVQPRRLPTAKPTNLNSNPAPVLPGQRPRSDAHIRQAQKKSTRQSPL